MLDMDKKNISNVKEKTPIVFPSCGIATLTKVLKSCGSDLITIGHARKCDEEKVPETIVVESGETTLSLFRADPKITYPNVDTILKHKYPYQITTQLKDWQQPIAAIGANYFYAYDLHNTKITANLRKGYFTLTNNTETQVKRKVNFALGTFEYDRTANTDSPWFCCDTLYFRDFAKNGNKNDKVVFHFENQAQLDEHTNKRVPILIEYPETHKADGLVEQFQLFFNISLYW